MRTLSSAIKESMKYAAYAVCCGFTIQGSTENRPPEFASGVPLDTLAFSKGTVLVFCTDKGWRIATRKADGYYNPPDDCDFYAKLFPALVAANTLHAVICATRGKRPEPLSAEDIASIERHGIVG